MRSHTVVSCFGTLVFWHNGVALAEGAAMADSTCLSLCQLPTWYHGSSARISGTAKFGQGMAGYRCLTVRAMLPLFVMHWLRDSHDRIGLSG